MLHKLIEMEFYKLKGNKTLIITVIGALLLPILFSIAHSTMGRLDFQMAFDYMNDFNLTMFSIIFTAVIINYLFTVDTETHTLKSIITLPVNMRTYLLSKLITLFIWMIGLALITIIAGTILFPLVGMKGFALNTILKFGGQYLFGTSLLFLVMIPLVFVIVATKNTSAGLVISALLLFLNATVDSVEKLAYCPWTIPGKMSANALTIPSNKAWIIVIATTVIGYALTRYILNKRDITL